MSPTLVATLGATTLAFVNSPSFTWQLVLDDNFSLGLDPAPGAFPSPIIIAGPNSFWQLTADDNASLGAQFPVNLINTPPIVLATPDGDRGLVVVDDDGALGAEIRMKKIIALILLIAGVASAQTNTTSVTMTRYNQQLTGISTNLFLSNSVLLHAALLDLASTSALAYVSNGVHNVVNFGALGAPNDDTAAIQACLNSGTCYLPPGSFYATTLNISNP